MPAAASAPAADPQHLHLLLLQQHQLQQQQQQQRRLPLLQLLHLQCQLSRLWMMCWCQSPARQQPGSRQRRLYCCAAAPDLTPLQQLLLLVVEVGA